MTELQKTAAVITRHSRMLWMMVDQVRSTFPLVVEHFQWVDEKPQWTIEVGPHVIGGPATNQWDAWQEAFNGIDHAQ